MKSQEDELDDALARLEPLSETEQEELFRRYLSAIVEGLTTPDLLRFRAYVLNKRVTNEPAVLEVIDRQFGLRVVHAEMLRVIKKRPGRVA